MVFPTEVAVQIQPRYFTYDSGFMDVFPIAKFIFIDTFFVADEK